MSITDELRVFAKRWPYTDYIHKDMLAIADRIDAEHERGMADAYLSGTPTDEKLTELGWIRLPKDADGEYISVGDVMEWPTTGETFEVVGIGEGTLFYVEDGSEYADWTGASTKRHYHAPTVEDVLREVIDKATNSIYTIGDILSEYAAKLRLAGDGE